MLAWRGAAPSDEATYNFAMPGMPEMTGIRERLNSCVEELNVASQQPKMRQPLSVAIPLYIYPGENCWNALFDTIAKHPSVVFHLIVNPANGPGRQSLPDSNYVKEVARLNTFNNCTIFGYVHVSWGVRDVSLVKEDVTTWSRWKDHKQADIHVEGIFVDEAPAELDKLEYMTELYNHVKATLGNDALIWTNPGVQINRAFYDVADLVNSHENTHEAWRQGLADSSDLKSTAMIHSYTGTVDDMRSDIQTLRKDGYRSALITTSNCYTAFSPYMEAFVEAIELSNDKE